MTSEYISISESVTAAHPDKLCDRISDEIVDRLLEQDPASRVVAEAAMFGGVVFLATRIATSARIDLAETARRVLTGAGYHHDDYDAESASILTSSLGTLPESYPRVRAEELDEAGVAAIPAGNQVTVFGFAARQTASLMPLPIELAHALARGLEQAARRGDFPYLMPDGKSQVAVAYHDRTPRRIHSVSLVVCRRAGMQVAEQRLRDDLIQAVVEPVFAEREIRPDASTLYAFNPEGPFVGGGPQVHCGLTGRKTAADNYGGMARHSGAALSGKDPLRIDRVGAYAARWVAKQVVAAGLAEQCELQLSYTAGEAWPLSIQVDCFNTERIGEAVIEGRIRNAFDLRPAAIVRDLRLQSIAARPGGFYRHLTSYGHMGREDLDAPWERLDRIDALTAA
ncbi:methionine adenosyltransferase [Lamprobacter modestohalophilus]|uniref:Methionine adenosyltransferase n=1 Tax=Lamprobacter modestohalophilus TaxID=1064514 RepID=A0A9X0W844_9GAMM|nr:methionine adenosyltransferase [Lamprobacter modestohalophilus]MBK1618730.1 methionine adenosyltransferase [Lamprobacter modestohalophilus]MCF7995372.1 methionine adenosyltransferase [Chromatiaceae bacterium]MCF8015313.1 methionine adenosyltransferase [Chromatiaceae bacterium]